VEAGRSKGNRVRAEEVERDEGPMVGGGLEGARSLTGDLVRRRRINW